MVKILCFYGIILIESLVGGYMKNKEHRFSFYKNIWFWWGIAGFLIFGELIGWWEF